METLEPSPTPENNKSNENAKISIPGEIIEDILSRVPVKSILRFTSVSKPWLSLISFPTLHSSRSHRTSLFISAYDSTAWKRYFLSAPLHGGPVTHISTIDTLYPSSRSYTESEHLNGLVCFTSANGNTFSNYAFVINPSTHKSFKIPDFATPLTSYPKRYGDIEWATSYLFGFDESRNEHKVLNIRIGTRRFSFMPTKDIQVFIFSMLDYTWRKINVEVPMDDLQSNNKIKSSVCVGSVIYFMFPETFVVLTFDLRTEIFSRVDVPDDPLICDLYSGIKKINGCVGLVCYDVCNNKVVIWVLRDYESCFWVRETVAFLEGWDGLDRPFLLDSGSMDEIVFASRRSSRGVISVYVYNMKTRCFRQVEFALTHPFLGLKTVEFDQIKCYVESLVSLQGNSARTR